MPLTSFAQGDEGMTWWNPAESGAGVVKGRGWSADLAAFYDRLPARAETVVRKEVWDLSRNSAGEYIAFTTESDRITVRYTVTGALNKPHMSSTGASGIDLYLKEDNGNWIWVKGTFSFRDTIEYRFTNIDKSIRRKEFRLYLPLYNTIANLHIGTPRTHPLRPVATADNPAVVVYGTSIAQGACASRAGLAWTNMLGRKLATPVINLGFSGNGQLEPALISLLLETNARVFVLDCMPNLWDRKKFSEDTVAARIVSAVTTLRSRRPDVPVLLAEHCDGLPGTNADSAMRMRLKKTSEVLRRTFAALQKQGVTNLFLLQDDAIGFTGESTVDGTHPNDIGMLQYANAYYAILTRMGIR